MNTENITTTLNEIIDKYSTNLTESGVKCTVQKKHFTLRYSHEPHTPANAWLFSWIDKAIYKFRVKLSPFKDDNYSCIVIKFEPINSSFKKSEIKEYAFISSNSEDWKKIKNRSAEIPDKTEKLIQKTLKKLNKKPIDKVCKDSFLDIIRYTTQNKYCYKKHILGHDKNIVDTVFNLIFIILLVALCAITLVFM